MTHKSKCSAFLLASPARRASGADAQALRLFDSPQAKQLACCLWVPIQKPHFREAHELVPREGIEPPTCGIEAHCSNPLSYRGVVEV